MFSLDAKDIMDEIRTAEELRDKHLIVINEIVRRICGRYYRSDALDLDPTPENLPYQFLDFVLPQLVWEAPEITCNPCSGGDPQTAEDIKAGLNQWRKDGELKNVLWDLALDMLTGYAMTAVGLESRGQNNDGGADVQGMYTLPATRPFMERIPRADVIIDGMTKDRRRARFIGRRFEMDVDDLARDPRVNIGPEGAPGSIEAGERDGAERGPFPSSERPQGRKRRAVIYEIYVPEHRKVLWLLEDGPGGHGRIIRDIPYYGPADGPFQFWGAKFMPDLLYPLAPLPAVWEQFVELQESSTVIDDANARAKRVTLVDAADPGARDALKDTDNGAIIPVKGLRGILNVDVGGANPESLKQNEILKDRMDRALGHTSAQSGKSNNNTATSNQIADANASTRIDGLRQAFREHLVADLRKVAWYLWNEESVIFNLTIQDPMTGQQVMGTFAGGVWPGQENQSVTDYAVDIDIHSMVRVDSALMQKRAQDAAAIIGQFAPLIPQTPWVRWDGLFNVIGDALNMKDFAEKVLNVDMLRQMGVWGPPQGMAPGMMGGMAGGPMQSAAPQVGTATPQGLSAGLAGMN